MACRDRQEPGVGARLVFDLDCKRPVRSISSGPAILFDDRDVPVKVTPDTIEWGITYNDYTSTLEVVAGRVYPCQRISPAEIKRLAVFRAAAGLNAPI